MTGLWMVPAGITGAWLLSELLGLDWSSLPVRTCTALGIPMALGAWITWGFSWLF